MTGPTPTPGPTFTPGLTFAVRPWPLRQPFRFAGHTITALECVHVVLHQQGVQDVKGQGEGVLPVVFDITAQQVLQQLQGVQEQLAQGGDVQALCAALPPGPARNALDCALWDLRAKTSGRSIWQLAGLAAAPDTIEVDETIGLASVQRMALQAQASSHRVLKIKLDATDVLQRVQAIRTARPDAQLIIDANQSWSPELLQQHGRALAHLGVRLIEQPLRCGQDEALAGLACPIPIYADESCHVAADLPRLQGLYSGINIKLDKTGGLTEALALIQAARARDLGVMVGCMAGTSLSMAPAYVIASLSDWADLDGPLLLARDRTPSMAYRHGRLAHFDSRLWG